MRCQTPPLGQEHCGRVSTISIDGFLGNRMVQAAAKRGLRPLGRHGSRAAPGLLRGLGDGAVCVMCDVVAHQGASIRGARVGDRRATIGSNHVDVEVHQPLAGDGPASCAHAVGSVTNRAAEAGVDVITVMVPAGIGDDVA